MTVIIDWKEASFD